MREVAGIFALGLVILLVVIWAINDAQRWRKSALLVCIAVVFFFPLGWIAWLLFRPPLEEQDSPEIR